MARLDQTIHRSDVDDLGARGKRTREEGERRGGGHGEMETISKSREGSLYEFALVGEPWRGGWPQFIS